MKIVSGEIKINFMLKDLKGNVTDELLKELHTLLFNYHGSWSIEVNDMKKLKVEIDDL